MWKLIAKIKLLKTFSELQKYEIYRQEAEKKASAKKPVWGNMFSDNGSCQHMCYFILFWAYYGYLKKDKQHKMLDLLHCFLCLLLHFLHWDTLYLVSMMSRYIHSWQRTLSLVV